MVGSVGEKAQLKRFRWQLYLPVSNSSRRTAVGRASGCGRGDREKDRMATEESGENGEYLSFATIELLPPSTLDVYGSFMLHSLCVRSEGN
jgi:hypothetical protein